MTAIVRRGDERPVTSATGITSRHWLSFGAYYDPERTAVGALVAHNEDVLAPGVSYGAHEHRDVEILTWVLSGTMRHRGPDGTGHDVGPGTLQHLAAGTGWHHDEACAGDEPCHLVQMWVAPGLDDPPPGEPALTHVDVDPSPGSPVAAAGGPDAAVALRRGGVSLTVARLDPGQAWTLPDGSARHAFVARGSVVLAEGHTAGEGDALESFAPGDITVRGGDGGAELLVWATV